MIPVVTDVAAGDRKIDIQSRGDIRYLRVASECGNGTTMQTRPDGAAVVLREVDASDGKPFAVELKAILPSFVLHLTHADGTQNDVTFGPGPGDFPG